MDKGIDEKNQKLIRETAKAWQVGELSDGAAMLVVATIVLPKRGLSAKILKKVDELAKRDSTKKGGKNRYNLYRNCNLVLSTNDKSKVWDEIGKSWAPYEVLGPNGESIEEFVPL